MAEFISAMPIHLAWMLTYKDLKIVESAQFVAQYRFPKTKNRRIRKKWAEQKRNFRPRRNALLDVERNTAYMHPEAARSLRAEINNK